MSYTMTLQDFITQNDGKVLNFDGAYGNQCMDLFEFYNRDVIGNPTPVAGNAIDVQNTYPKAYYSWVANTPTNVPEPGDVVIWGNSPGLTGQYGHIDVFISGDANAFTGFDQNWPSAEDANGNGVGVCHRQPHIYQGVLGWLHPISQTPTTGTYVDQATFNKLVHNSGVADSLSQYVGLPTNSDWSIIQPKLDAFKTAISQMNSDFNAVSADLGLPSGSSKDIIVSAINKIKADKATQDATLINLNNTITQKEGENTTLQNQITSLQQQLKIAQDSLNEPNSGLAYKDLYTQSETNLTSAKQALGELQKTTNQQIAQLKNTSATTIPLAALWKILLSRQFGLS